MTSSDAPRPGGGRPRPPAGRYTPRASAATGLSGKVLALLLAALVVGILAAGALLAYRYFSTPEISAKPSGFEVVDDHTMDLRLDVTRDHPETPVVCVIRAREGSGAEVGRREVAVAPGTEKTTRLTVRLATTGRAVDADSYGCGEDAPAYLRR